MSIAFPMQWSEVSPAPQSLAQNTSLTLPGNSSRMAFAPSTETARHELETAGTLGAE